MITVGDIVRYVSPKSDTRYNLKGYNPEWARRSLVVVSIFCDNEFAVVKPENSGSRFLPIENLRKAS